MSLEDIAQPSAELATLFQVQYRLDQLIESMQRIATLQSGLDVSPIVEAVVGLKPGATAEEIAREIGKVLQFPAPADPTGALADVAEAMKKLDFRLKGIGVQAYGGGAVELAPNQHVIVDSLPATGGGLTDAQLRASPVAVTGGGGGTEYTEDLVPPADPIAGTRVLRRRDALVVETSTDGDWTVPNVTSKGEQYVKHVDSVPVTGTFWQATQPVSGTFYQATQPVSGTFWQATQPVSIASALDISDRAARLLGVVYGSQAQQLTQTPTNYNLKAELAVGATLIDPRDVSDRAARLLGVVYGSQAQQLVQTPTNFNLKAELAVGATLIDPRDVSDRAARLVGRVRLTDDTNVSTVKAASTAAVAADTALVVAVSPNNTLNVDVSDRAARLVGRARLTDDTNLSTIRAASTAPAAADTALVVANRPPVGYSQVAYTADRAAGSTSAALISMVLSRDGGAEAAGATTFAVTANKRLVLDSITIGFLNGATAPAEPMQFCIRWTTTGAVAATSPRAWSYAPNIPAINVRHDQVSFPINIVLTGTMQFGVSQLQTTTACTNVSVQVTGHEEAA